MCCVAVRGQSERVGSLFLPYGSRRWNSGHEAAEPSYQFIKIISDLGLAQYVDVEKIRKEIKSKVIWLVFIRITEQI